MANSTIAVRHVRTARDRSDFLRVPFAIYRHDSNWVAPLFVERQEHLNPAKNPYFDHAEAQLFVAEKNGQPCGRISAQIDRLRLDRYADATGQFGFLEAPDDPSVFAALFGAAEAWLRERSMTRVEGPFSFSINEETGLLIDGFDSPPSIMMGHARPYYASRIEEQGFRKIKDVYAYEFDGTQTLPSTMQRLFDKTLGSRDVSIRALEKKNLSRDLDIIIALFNDAWSDNWGFVPFTRHEIEALGRNLKMLVEEKYIAIADYRGEPAAMCVTLPNINDWIRGLDGRLMPFGWAKLAWHLFARPPRSIRMPLMGVRRQFHGKYIGTALAAAVIDTIRRYHVGRGTTIGELSWILEDNVGMRRIIEGLGARRYKTYRIYEKSL